tara:strand:- start:95 stop:451 length:357 start_codon:yes stop_codon:yes gene_type:complete
MGRALGLFQDAFGGTKRKIKGEKLEIKTPEYILSSASLRKTAKRLKKNPATLARLDNSKKIREQAGKIAKRNGQGIETYLSGQKYEGQWRDGEIDGEGKFFYSGGSKYIKIKLLEIKI